MALHVSKIEWKSTSYPGTVVFDIEQTILHIHLYRGPRKDHYGIDPNDPARVMNEDIAKATTAIVEFMGLSYAEEPTIKKDIKKIIRNFLQS